MKTCGKNNQKVICHFQMAKVLNWSTKKISGKLPSHKEINLNVNVRFILRTLNLDIRNIEIPRQILRGAQKCFVMSFMCAWSNQYFFCTIITAHNRNVFLPSFYGLSMKHHNNFQILFFRPVQGNCAWQFVLLSKTVWRAAVLIISCERTAHAYTQTSLHCPLVKHVYY